MDNKYVKKTTYDKLVTKVHAIDTKMSSATAFINKSIMIWTSRVLKKKIEDMDKEVSGQKI